MKYLENRRIWIQILNKLIFLQQQKVYIELDMILLD